VIWVALYWVFGCVAIYFAMPSGREFTLGDLIAIMLASVMWPILVPFFLIFKLENVVLWRRR
jgi:cytochrome c oxidase assembly factor CtaG